MSQESQRKWVFRELVKHDNDYQGLLAYVAYKIEKDKLATDWRSKGNSEPEIERSLQEFHDTCVMSSQLDEFRKKGLDVMRALTAEIDVEYDKERKNLIQKHKEELEKKERAHKEELVKRDKKVANEERKRIFKNIEKAMAEKNGFLIRSIMWVLNGFQSIIAMCLLIVVIFGFALWSADDKTQNLAVGNFWNRIINSFSSPIPSPESKYPLITPYNNPSSLQNADNPRIFNGGDK